MCGCSAHSLRHIKKNTFCKTFGFNQLYHSKRLLLLRVSILPCVDRIKEEKQILLGCCRDAYTSDILLTWEIAGTT